MKTTKPQKKQNILSVAIDLDAWISDDTTLGMLEARIVETVSNLLAKKLEDFATKAIIDQCRNQFEALAEKHVVNYFTKQHFKTDSWGEKTGDNISLQDHLLQAFQSYLSEKVDTNGQTTTYSQGTNRTQWLLTKLAHEPLAAAVTETVGKIATEAKRQVQDSVSRYIAEQLTRPIDVPQLKH